MHLFIYALVLKKEKIHQNYTNFIIEIKNIYFSQI